MSTDLRTKDKVRMEDLLDGRLEHFGVSEHFVKGSTSVTNICLTDGHSNYLWICGDQEVELLTRFGRNGNPETIVRAIEVAFDTEIFSEHQPQFWGYETKEEWENALDEIYEKDQAEQYLDIMKYVRGEPHNIKPKTNDMTMANIAKDLIAQNPKLASSDCKEELMENVDRIWKADHCTTIMLDESDIAAMQLAMTNVKDLPSV